MIGQKNINQLDTIIKYEENEEIKIRSEERPVFHVTPTVGWANDPNGFSIYNGEYHLFYQYYPFDTKWGPMHWGHVKSKDFIKWDRLPCALAPDKDYETGCFSGSAIEIEDGRHMIVYTSHFEKEIEGIKVRKEYQSIAFGDGIKYTKFDGNPVITADQLPKGFSHEDFRDPKIWREEDEFYVKKNRIETLYKKDQNSACRTSHGNPEVQKLYADFLGEPGSHLAESLLHTAYNDLSSSVKK